MLFLLFQIGNDRYAIEAQQAIEVVPLVELKRLPHAARGVAGLFNYRGRPVPAIDLSELTSGRTSRECLSTRIIIVEVGSVEQEVVSSELVSSEGTTPDSLFPAHSLGS